MKRRDVLKLPALLVPSMYAGKGAESLVLQAASHQDDDLKMPPRDNKAKAKNLTPPQLALLKLWMDQGAKPSPKTERVIAWQPLPESVNAILSVTVTPDDAKETVIETVAEPRH